MLGIFDRSAEPPTGGPPRTGDGTAWMAMFCQNMFEMAVEHAVHDPSDDDLVFKFAEHFLWIGAAMNKVGHDGMWDEEDGFYDGVLRLPDGRATRLKVRSLVGLLPLCSTTVIDSSERERVPRVIKALEARFGHIAANPVAHAGRTGVPGPLRHPLDLEVARAAAVCALFQPQRAGSGAP